MTLLLSFFVVFLNELFQRFEYQEFPSVHLHSLVPPLNHLIVRLFDHLILLLLSWLPHSSFFSYLFTFILYYFIPFFVFQHSLPSAAHSLPPHPSLCYILSFSHIFCSYFCSFTLSASVPVTVVVGGIMFFMGCPSVHPAVL